MDQRWVLGCDRWTNPELPEAKISLSAKVFLVSNRGVGDQRLVVRSTYSSTSSSRWQ